MLSYIALLPGIWAFMLASKTSPQNAFVRAYIPCLLFLPDYYRAVTPGIPDPNFSQSAAVGLLIASLMAGFPGYRFTWMDPVVLGYAFCAGYSEFLASGYSDAQNLIFTMLFSVVAPYLYAKSYIEPAGQRFVFAKTVVLVLTTLAAISVYETRLGLNPWAQVVAPFFPGQPSWVVTFRFGFARAAGPYGTALLAGVIMAVGYRLQRWLQWSGAWPMVWPKQFKFLAWLPMKPPTFLTIGLLGGLIVTFAKGAWLATIISTLIIMIGRSKNRVLGVAAVLACIVFVLIPAVFAFIAYASVGRANAKDDNQETAAYRYELIIGYVDIAAERADWGWGLNKWPTVDRMPSIDNHYLLLFLMHGKWAFYLFLIVLVVTPVRLITYAMKSPPSPVRGSSLPFTLAAIYLIYIVSIGTVYMGLQTLPVLFIITGWSESYLLLRGRDQLPGAVAAPAGPACRTGFRRVI